MSERLTHVVETFTLGQLVNMPALSHFAAERLLVPRVNSPLDVTLVAFDSEHLDRVVRRRVSLQHTHTLTHYPPTMAHTLPADQATSLTPYSSSVLSSQSLCPMIDSVLTKLQLLAKC